MTKITKYMVYSLLCLILVYISYVILDFLHFKIISKPRDMTMVRTIQNLSDDPFYASAIKNMEFMGPLDEDALIHRVIFKKDKYAMQVLALLNIKKPDPTNENINSLAQLGKEFIPEERYWKMLYLVTKINTQKLTSLEEEELDKIIKKDEGKTFYAIEIYICEKNLYKNTKFLNKYSKKINQTKIKCNFAMSE